IDGDAMKAAAYTLGCKVNQYDTQAMLELLQQAGYEIVPFGQKADVYIINSCTVTNMADRKSRQMIGRAVQLNEDAVVVVAGCLTQRSGEEILAMPGVRAVLGTGDRGKIASIVQKARQEKVNAVATDKPDFENLSVHSGGNMTRGYIKIQEGCNQYCSYCIIPYVRGRARSRPLAGILEEARSLTGSRVREVVLTGINISSYRDGDFKLADVLEGLDRIDGLDRIRLGSLEPGLLTPAFIAGIARINKLCPHFHVSLQSGSDSVLARMNRTYTTEAYAAVIQNLRQAFDNPAITTDVITGFPGESDAEFRETQDFIGRIGFSRLHVFPYSQRTGTKATQLPGAVPVELRKSRASELIAIGRGQEYAYSSGFVGRAEEVLFEHSLGGGWAEGHTTRYVKVHAKAEPYDLKLILMTTLKNDILTGESDYGG
ncbi:MAG: tRNA (N(6)-L-threonylcarbamoyladenosine(37)-C(2))-methylthiotransferase MtaB, partial [Eubacteriales bacterium]